MAKFEIKTYVGVGFRLIPSRFPPVSVYAGLTANDRLDELVEVENQTNPRLQSESWLLSKYGSLNSPQLQNWNLAPFKYINPEGSRFYGPLQPALELADNIQTALAIAVRRRETFLRRTKEPPIGLDMRMLKTPISGRFADLRNLPMELNQAERREAAAAIPDECDGLLFRPHERPSAECVAVTNKDALGRTIQTEHYRFDWNGDRISSIYAFTKKGDVFEPESLFGQETILAA